MSSRSTPISSTRNSPHHSPFRNDHQIHERQKQQQQQQQQQFHSAPSTPINMHMGMAGSPSSTSYRRSGSNAGIISMTNDPSSLPPSVSSSPFSRSPRATPSSKLSASSPKLLGSRSSKNVQSAESPGSVSFAAGSVAASSVSPLGPAFSGKWEHPAFREIALFKARNSFTDVDRGIITRNSLLLIFLLYAFRADWFSQLQVFAVLISKQKNADTIVIWAVYTIIFVCFGNIMHSLRKLTQAPLTFNSMALSPPQRRLLGLENELKGDSSSSSTAIGKSDLKYSDVKPPRYENMSPVKRSLEKVLRERSSNLGDRLSSHASPQKGTHTTPKSRIYSSVQRAQQSPNSPVSPLTSYLLKNSPVNLEAEPIRDKAALESLMQNIETNTRMWQSDGTEGLANTSGPSGSYLFTSTGGGVSAFSTSPSVLKFKAASKLSSTADRVVKERIEDGLVVKDPATVIFELKIDPYIDEWTENIRKWLSTKVLGPLASRIDAADKAFRENNISDLDCSTTVVPGTSNMFLNRGLGPIQDQSAARLDELASKYPNMQIIKERQKLEHFLHFPDYSCRPYILGRIRELARGGCLSAFQWNSGGVYQGRPFNQDQLPTDDQLVMRLFCCFLDEMMPGESSGIFGSKPFTNKYYLPVDSKPDVMRSIQIRHYTKHPAHYNLIVDKTIWDVYPKRNNVFQTLVLFTYYVKLVAGGYLGLLNLGGNSINLLSILSKN